MGWSIVSGPHVGHWVTEQTNGGYHADRSEAIGLEKDGELIAGTVYEMWNGRSVVCHIAWKRINKAYLTAVYDYAYNVCNVDKIIGPISSNHTRALKLVTKMGFSEEARIKNAAPDGDIVFMTQTLDKCRFLESRYGQEFAKAAASA
jgi:RimJ/RimL family protein N-acetyltransferase